MLFSIVTKNSVFSYTPSANKKGAQAKNKGEWKAEKAVGPGEGMKETNEKPWVSANRLTKWGSGSRD